MNEDSDFTGDPDSVIKLARSLVKYRGSCLPLFTNPLESTILLRFRHWKYIDNGYTSGHNSKTQQLLYKKLTFPDHTSSLMPSTFEEFNLFHILSVFFSTNQDYDHLLNRRNPPHQRDAGVSKPPEIRRIWDETEGF